MLELWHSLLSLLAFASNLAMHAMWTMLELWPSLESLHAFAHGWAMPAMWTSFLCLTALIVAAAVGVGCMLLLLCMTAACSSGELVVRKNGKALSLEKINPSRAKPRIMVVGCCGSGKSTLAKRLASCFHLKYIDADDLFWKPGWKKSGPQEFRLQIHQAMTKAKQTGWASDGNYNMVRDIMWQQCTHIVWLDLHWSVIFLQLIKRSLCRSFYRLPVCNGNFESWSKFLNPKTSIMATFLKTYSSRTKSMSTFFDTGVPVHAVWIRARSRGDVEAVVSSLCGPPTKSQA